MGYVNKKNPSILLQIIMLPGRDRSIFIIKYSKPSRNNIYNPPLTIRSPYFFTHYTRVGTLIVATIYLQLIENRYRFRSFTSFIVVTSIVYNPLPAMWKS